jgi:PAS domain-containing protein
MVFAVVRFRLPGSVPWPSDSPATELAGSAPGLIAAELLSDTRSPDLVYLATHWTDLRAFQRWAVALARREGAAGPARPVLDRDYRLVFFVDHRTHPKGIVEPAALPVERPELVARFLSESRSAHVLALSRTGVILACNDAVGAALGLPLSKLLGQKIWRFLAEVEAGVLRAALEAEPAPVEPRFRLALVDARGAPLALDCIGTLRADGLVLIGEPVREDELRLQAQFSELNARVAALARENIRKSKALKRALTKLRATLEEMQGARAVWEATASLESSLRDLERSFTRLERTALPPPKPADAWTVSSRAVSLLNA